MKQLFALVLLLATFFASATAQKAESGASAADALAREATEKLVAKYALNADQGKEMYTIQQRKLRNLKEIEPLNASSRSLYLAKLEGVQKGTLTSIRRVLRSPEQVELYQNTQKEVRNQRAEKRKALVQQKAAREDIQAALLEIYAE